MRSNLVCGGLFILCAVPLSAQTPRYRWTNLGDLGFLGPNDVTGINDNLQVVGYFIGERRIIPPNIVQYLTHGYIWQDGNMLELAPLAGHNHCHVRGLSSNGLVVGSSQPSNGSAVAAIFPDDGSPSIALGPLDGTVSGANAVNASGMAVGALGPSAENSQAHLWNLATGVATDLGTLGGATSVARAINEGGVIVGTARSVDGDLRAFVIEPGGVMTDLNDRLPPESGWVLEDAVDINNSSVIVGIGTYQGVARSFLLRPGGDNPELLSPLPGDVSAPVAAINDHGIAVGLSFYFMAPVVARWTAVIWEDGTARDVNILIDGPGNPPWFEGVRNLNNRGHLVVRGVAGGGIRQYLLTPVCPADLNENGLIDLSDLTLLLNCFGQPLCSDLTGDGLTDLNDLTLLLSLFGQTCP